MTSSHVVSLYHFRNQVVLPSLGALSEKIDELHASDDPGSIFLASDFNELKRKTAEGYIIAIQSMWERGLRGMLASCESRICNGSDLEALKTATWSGRSKNLQDHFLRLVGIPIQSFSSFSDLDFLQTLGNAIRHGDGNSARRIYQMTPSLWPSQHKLEQATFIELMEVEVEKSVADFPPFDEIEIPLVVVDQMIMSVMWFWEDIENLRCNSFRRKHDSVIRKLSKWRAEIDRRSLERVWSQK